MLYVILIHIIKCHTLVAPGMAKWSALQLVSVWPASASVLATLRKVLNTWCKYLLLLRESKRVLSVDRGIRLVARGNPANLAKSSFSPETHEVALIGQMGGYKMFTRWLRSSAFGLTVWSDGVKVVCGEIVAGHGSGRAREVLQAVVRTRNVPLRTRVLGH